MNPDRLLKHFEQISEAPDAIPRLRRFILDLAVRGKLVEQNPEDEPASELLKRIEVERIQLVDTRDLRNQKEQPFDEEQFPFTIPACWRWSRLAQIGIINPKNYTEDSIKASFVPMPMIFAGYGQPNQHEVKLWAEIKKGFTHFAEGDVGLAKITPCFENGKSTVFRNLTGGIGAGTTELHIVRPILVAADYILIFLKSPFFINTGIPKMTGTAGQKRIPRDYFALFPFPLPPLAEQHRIVAKVDELMALCDELEAAQAKRERRRDRLVAATLHSLNNGYANTEPGNHLTFEENARFYFNHFPRLITRPEHIQQLRQTILNLALRGKLVHQDPNDEPASELLNRIEKERARMVKKNEIRKQELLLITNDGVPVDLPKGWVWCRLQDIFLAITDGDHQPPPKAEEGIPFLVIGNMRNRTIDFSNCRYVPETYYTGLDTIRRPQKGDILFTLVGSYGIPVRIPDSRPFCVQRHIGILRPSKQVDTGYITNALRSRFVFEQATTCATGIAQKTVSLTGLRKILIPFPPLAEQHRIAAKVDELMALCDELEAGLITTASSCRQLLEATLYGAISVGNL
ncbi:MAG: restriction endonuclease subunit S [Alphaproteobacteria bacterium]|uniref:Restriction endonuclease subunit S n=1 Tax=Candidatus Nitrobium versatile TaxID=2884831 RepID=A0A953SHC3_9BACT|nr:restriction endonuclease subunit S [Candidatus Nitrobium versatile]